MDSTATNPVNPAALAGLKVIELGQLIAGPFAAKTLAEFGADVIKIEPPGGGDPLRGWRMLKNGTSVWWQVQSRNKRSLALDLRTADGQEVVRKLAAEADVLGDAEIGDEIDLLVNGADPGGLGFAGGAGMDGAAVHRGLPGVARVHAGQGFDQGALAGTVFTHQGVDFPASGAKIHAIQRNHAGEAFGQAAADEDGRAHGRDGK
jgi:hypothetical protein